jgi:DNA replication protein DnaC
VLLPGPKTLREAILAGYTVRFATAIALVAGLAKEHSRREKLLSLSKPKLLIVDELGHLQLEPDAAHLFFQLVSCSYETSTMRSPRTVALPSGSQYLSILCATAILDS